MKKRVLSGIRATGRLHLGNYYGAVKGMLELANSSDYEAFYMVADLHTLTTPFEKSTLKQNIRDVIIDYLAAGLDPEKSVLFVQSQVPEHVELAYLFSTVTTVAKMQHLPTFKDKVKQHPESVTMALLNYPVLMAADILIYKANFVPVGLDQEPHLEVAREVARRMNQDYKTDFPEPSRFKTIGEYIPSITGEGKMSKTVEGSYINITDDLEEVKAKIAKIPTDEGKGNEITGGVKTLLDMVGIFEGEDKKEVFEANYKSEGLRYGEIKAELAEVIYKEIEPIQKRRAELEKDTEYVDRVIREGADKARKVASETIREVREKMGLL